MYEKEVTGFCDYRKNFEDLRSIIYKDFRINSLRFRVLGIILIDHGTDWNIKTHKHSFFEANYVVEDTSYTTINGMEYKVGPGQFFILTPGTLHSHREGAHKGFGLRWEVNSDYKKDDAITNSAAYQFERANNILANSAAFPINDENHIIYEAMVALLKLTEGKYLLLELQMAFFQLIMRLMHFYSSRTLDESLSINQVFLENNIVSNAIRFIDENYTQDIDVNDVASYVHLSYSHLSRLFKNYQSETIKNYINKARLTKAQQLLACTNKSIWQVADESGFNSENYFYNIFRKHFVISPGAYRNSKSRLTQ